MSKQRYLKNILDQKLDNALNSNKFKVAIIGCGKIGWKRALGLGPHARLVACMDINEDAASKFSREFGARAFMDVDDLLAVNIDAVLVCVQHDKLAEYALKSINSGRHVLIEKPGARSPGELDELIHAAIKQNVVVWVGYNHRYHPSILQAEQIVKSGVLGELMFSRNRYGHGGRLGYEKEWRANKDLSGGGELIDQGPHLIDINMRLFGDLKLSHGIATTLYWDMNVDDNAFLLLRSKKNQFVQLQVSCTEWKNLFSMEIYGKQGKLEVSGLGGSYGVEKLTYYKMRQEMGPPETTSWEFPHPDESFAVELEFFFREIRDREHPPASELKHTKKILSIISEVYRESGT